MIIETNCALCPQDTLTVRLLPTRKDSVFIRLRDGDGGEEVEFILCRSDAVNIASAILRHVGAKS